MMHVSTASRLAAYFLAIFGLSFLNTPASSAAETRWPVEKAWEWYRDLGPIAGCNYLPRTAVNSTEMWQKDTFDP